MLFSSITFLYYFLPAVIIVYFLLPFPYKNILLLIASLIFYAWGEPKYSFLMIFSCIEGFILGLLIEKEQGTRRGKILVIISVVVNLSLLGFFKYFNFFISNINEVLHQNLSFLSIALPMGISFYIFSIISYNIDIYRGLFKAERNIFDFTTYIAFFPQLVAGPIIRYSDILVQLHKREHSLSECYYGARRFIMGLAKKVLLANAFGALVSKYGESNEKTVLFYWLYAIGFTLQIYYDFSGYSDMAIGLGRIFGFRFLENFNYPYIAQSITDFWRRWHMSLSTWFKDYVYIPMGGNRVSPSKQIFNLLVVWMLTGFWHGAAWNFIVWGLYFAVILILERFLIKKNGWVIRNKIISHIYVMIIVIISFIIFNAETLTQAVSELLAMFGFANISLINTESLYYLSSYGVVLLFGIIGVTPLAKNYYNKIAQKKKIENVTIIIEPLFLTIILLVVTGYLVDGSFNPFLYFRF